MIKILLTLSVFLTGEIHAQQNYNKLNVKELDVTSRVNVVSTTKSSKPCPVMTLIQRDAIATPLTGSCVYNSTDLQLNIYDGALWQSAGGGGIENWDTATAYDVDDVVIESNKIYQCDIAHTSGTFATDLAANRWVELSAQGNLTGVISSTGLATTITSQTGTGSTFVVQNTPTLTTPNIGAATGTSLTLAGNISAYNYDKDNMLVNGNFENPLGAEWTCTVGTCSRTTATGEFSKDTAALKVALSAQAMNVSQTVTTPSGIQKQGYVRVIYRVPATMVDFQICTLVDAAEQTCVPTANLIKDDTFRSIEIPLTFGTTSAGIKFKTTSSYTANAYFDGAILAQGLGLQNLQGDDVYSAKVTTTSGAVTNTNKTGWVTCSAANPTVCTIASGINTQAMNCSATLARSGAQYTQIVNTYSTGVSTFEIFTYEAAGGATANVPVQLTCQKSGNDYLAASSNVYSQASANYGPTNAGTITIGATTTPPTKGTIVTDRVLHTRIGNRMIAEYQYEQSASGTAGTGDYLFTLPDGKSFDSTYVNFYTGDVGGTGAATAAQKSFVGSGVIGNGSARGRCELIAYSATQFRARCETIYTNQIFFGSAIYTLNGAIGFALTIDAPISGWSNSNVIVGSFENVPTTPGVVKPVLFSANITTTSGVISDNKGGIFTTCTAANPTICSHPGLISTPNCTMSADNTSAGSAQANWSAASTNSTQISIYTTNGSGAALASTKVKVICHGER